MHGKWESGNHYTLVQDSKALEDGYVVALKGIL